MKAEYTISQEWVQLLGSRPVRVQQLHVGNVIRPHDHEFYELVLVRSGSAQHLTSGGNRAVSKGDFLLLAPGQVHGFKDCCGFIVDNLYYLPEWVLQDSWLNDEDPLLFMSFLGAHLFPNKVPDLPMHLSLEERCFQRVCLEFDLLRDCAEDDSASLILIRGALMKCFAWVAGEMDESLLTDYLFIRNPVVRRLLHRMERAITEGERCNVSLWAEEMGYSTDHASRLFRNATGHTLVGLYQGRRLLHATHALIYTDDSLIQIAHRFGFSDSAHFSRQFREGYGMTPSLYRKRFRSDPRD